MGLIDNLTKGMKEDMVKAEMIKQRDAAKAANPAVKSLSAVCVIDENDNMTNRVFGSDVLEWIKKTEEGALKVVSEIEELKKVNVTEREGYVEIMQGVKKILECKKADSTKIKEIKKLLQ